MFKGKYHLCIHREIKEKLEGFPGVAFDPVVFEKLVDVDMPKFGDLSLDQKALDDPRISIDADKFLNRYPDVPDFHGTIGEYYSLVTQSRKNIELRDEKEFEFNFSYYRHPGMVLSVPLSESFFESQSALKIVQTFAFRPDVFEHIQPHLPSEYFAIAYLNTDRKKNSKPLTLAQIMGKEPFNPNE